MENKMIRRLVFGVFVIVGLAIIGLLGLKQAAQTSPAYYSEIIKAEATVDTKQRHDQAETLVGDMVQLRNDLANDPEWTFRLTDLAVNAWLGEHQLAELVQPMPQEIAEPRVRFETERLKIAFRWNGKPLESVISATICPSMISTNELQIVIEQVQAGLLPVSWSRFQSEIATALSDHGQQATWKTVDGSPALVLKISPVMQSKLIAIDKITLLEGELRLTGQTERKMAAGKTPNSPK